MSALFCILYITYFCHCWVILENNCRFGCVKLYHRGTRSFHRVIEIGWDFGKLNLTAGRLRQVQSDSDKS